MAAAALVCGILGIVGGFLPVVCYFTLVLAVLGIVFGVKARKQLASEGAPTGLATAGLVLGIIGTVFSAVCTLCSICACAIVMAGAGF